MVIKGDEILSKIYFSPHVEGFTFEGCDKHPFLKDSIKILSNNFLLQYESFKVMKDDENGDSLYVYDGKDPILESFHFEVNVVLNLLDIVDIEIMLKGFMKMF